MPLIYSFVARGTTVLADYTAHNGNFSTVAIQCLEKIPANNNKFTFTCDKHTFNYTIDGGYTFLAVAGEDFGRQIPFAFLERIKAEWREKLADKSRTATAHSLDKTFGPRLKFHMEYCETHPEEMSKVASVQKQVANVQDIMMKNIESVLERGEKIELLVDKTDNLRFQADKFHKTGKQLRSKMWWQNMRMKIIIVIVVIVLILVIFLLACFAPTSHCIK